MEGITPFLIILLVGALIFVIVSVLYEIASEYRYKKQIRGDKHDKHRYFK